jgi:deazaflavin-dependent oxidoreductase (nitroreductase family)
MDVNAHNRGVIEGFRANGGRVPDWGDTPVAIVHHVGRKSGTAYENPLAYLAGPNGRLYLFGSFLGAPKDPQWVENLRAAGRATVEVGEEVFQVTVTELVGSERDEVFEQQKAAKPEFADFEAKTAGLRTIPVLALDRVAPA